MKPLHYEGDELHIACRSIVSTRLDVFSFYGQKIVTMTHKSVSDLKYHCI